MAQSKQAEQAYQQFLRERNEEWDLIHASASKRKKMSLSTEDEERVRQAQQDGISLPVKDKFQPAHGNVTLDDSVPPGHHLLIHASDFNPEIANPGAASLVWGGYNTDGVGTPK